VRKARKYQLYIGMRTWNWPITARDEEEIDETASRPMGKNALRG
jgi:hypothetical protein